MISIIILDIDGTLTDSSIYYSDGNVETKAFSTKDGLAIKAAKDLGILTVFLTGRESKAVSRRAEDLGAVAVQGIEDKLPALKELLLRYDISSENAVYIGDDLNDYTAMKICGFKACPADAADEIKAICDYVCPLKGGHGAVRDIIEKILKDNDKYKEYLKLFGINQ